MDRRRSDQLLLPILATLLVHAGLGGGLYAAGELLERKEKPKKKDGSGELIDIEPPKAKVQIENKIEPPIVEPVIEKVVEPVVKKKRMRKRIAQTQTTPPPTTEPPEIDPAPGPMTNDDSPAPTWTMPNPGQGGTVAIPKGKRKRGPTGTGGAGTNTGGGGKPGSLGRGPPKPVSVASLKTRPKPIGDTDFVDARKNYPPDAKRLGIEGTVKVRLVIDATGRVVKRSLIKKLGHGLDQLAMKLAKKLQFKPAIDTNNLPVAAAVVWTFNFRLP